jgi:hypothetical protein
MPGLKPLGYQLKPKGTMYRALTQKRREERNEFERWRREYGAGGNRRAGDGAHSGGLV